MAVMIGSARIDENGKARGGKAGDQTGRELSTQKWYKHEKGWRVFRAKVEEVAEKIAWDMQAACDNKNIGYDQGERLTLYEVSKPLGFNCAAVKTPCETDCSALVRVCCAYAGVMLPNFRTPTEPKVLLDSGAFIELTGARYTDASTYLKRGDILCTKTQGHTVVVLSNGSKAGSTVAPVVGLSRGDKGSKVKEMQRALLIWKPDCLPVYGADGEFGAETENAMKAYQTAANLPVTGVYDEATRKALNSIGAPEWAVMDGDMNVRSAPGTDARVLGVVKKGAKLPYEGESKEVNGRLWYCVEYLGENAWISSKYSHIEK